MIKRFCDVCGKEIKESENHYNFEWYLVCKDCYKHLNLHAKEWHRKVNQLFKEWACAVVAAGELRKKSKPAKTEKAEKPSKPAPHTHVCKSKGDLPASVATVKGTPKGHVHKLVTTPELAKAIGAKVHTLQCFALRKGLGVIDAKRRVRVYNAEDAEVIRRHFKEGK